MQTATQEMMRYDLRRKRAQQLTSAVIRKLMPRIDATDPEDLRYDIARIVHETMFEVMHDEGVEVLTDYDRQQIGLPPRGPDGWTPEEMLLLEQRRLDLLMRPLNMVVPCDGPKTDALQSPKIARERMGC